MDREKVIKGLEYCKHTDGVECPNCPYWHDDDCVETLHSDTLELLKEDCHNCKLECLLQKYDELKEKYDSLLKEQEAIEPKHNPLSPTDWFCGKCGMCISRFHDCCPSCGRKVTWE